MAASSKLTLLQLRTLVRQELQDPSARWWSDVELNQYIQDWQQRLQSDYEFVWGTATQTVGAGTSTFTLTAIDTAMQRIDAVYYKDPNYFYRISPRTKTDLELIDNLWRQSGTSTTDIPRVVYQDDSNNLVVWPPSYTTGTYIFEYPKSVQDNLATDTNTMQIPAWTKYSVVDYVCYRAFQRFGPNQDLKRSSQRKKQFAQYCAVVSDRYGNYFPHKWLQLRPGTKYEFDILGGR